jgi:CRISPR-associated protein Csb2
VAQRLRAEEQAAAAIAQALRHAGLKARNVGVRAQSEPFHTRGVRADVFEPGRFDWRRLHHVEIDFAEPAAGPLVIGDGRYVGLGLMAPVKDAWRDVMSFPIKPEEGISLKDGPALIQAVRRALMALARDHEGRISPLFSGHAADGGPARNGHHEHIFLAADDADGDELVDRLIVAAPWTCDRTMHSRRADREWFDRTVSRLAQNPRRAARYGHDWPPRSVAQARRLDRAGPRVEEPNVLPAHPTSSTPRRGGGDIGRRHRARMQAQGLSATRCPDC